LLVVICCFVVVVDLVVHDDACFHLASVLTNRVHRVTSMSVFVAFLSSCFVVVVCCC
jgi:hypothetical protein